MSEAVFRLRQEVHNLRGYLRPPRLPQRSFSAEMVPLLPEGSATAAALAGTPYASSIVTLANRLLEHRFPLLGLEIETGREIAWNRDYVTGKQWAGSDFLRRIPYLDSSQVGDHKVVWELNRHQHLVVLAQAWLFTRDHTYLNEIEEVVIDWSARNPYARGLQWTSALECAFRVLSWLWVWQLAGSELSERSRRVLLESTWQHGLFLERNLSTYFSPNTHLLGEAAALHAIGRLFPSLPRAERWREIGGRIVSEEMDHQVRADGSHFEQSSYYHVYACDFFLFHALLTEAPQSYHDRLMKMGEYLWSLLGPAGQIPLMGDDDGGRLFHPYGDRAKFGRGTLAALGRYLRREEWRNYRDASAEIAAWWLGPDSIGASHQWRDCLESRCFADAGVATIVHDSVQIIVDVRAFGALRSGHSHEHALNLIVRVGEEELLTDPGAYTYTGDPRWREIFRSGAMHNTVRIGTQRQAQPHGPFGWQELPRCQITAATATRTEGVCEYAGFSHRRVVEYSRDTKTVAVTDTIQGPAVKTRLEQHWHPGVSVERESSGGFRLGRGAKLTFPPGSDISRSRGGDLGWISAAYGTKTEADWICHSREGALPATLRATIEID